MPAWLGNVPLRKARSRKKLAQKLGKIEVGVEVKNCKDCERGNCQSCGYKIHSERISKLPDCNVCLLKSSCQYVPRPGDYTRVNCPLCIPGPEYKTE